MLDFSLGSSKRKRARNCKECRKRQSHYLFLPPPDHLQTEVILSNVFARITSAFGTSRHFTAALQIDRFRRQVGVLSAGLKAGLLALHPGRATKGAGRSTNQRTK